MSSVLETKIMTGKFDLDEYLKSLISECTG